MKLSFILMAFGIVIFAIGLIMTFTGSKSKQDASMQTAQASQQHVAVQTVTNESESVEEPSQPEIEPAKPDSKSRSKQEDPKAKGNDFEDFVANTLKQQGIRIKEWNKGTVTDEGAFGENALNPDMFVVDNSGDKALEYWIECKYRSAIPASGFELEQYQIDRYSSIQGRSKRKILIALGVAGSPNNPQRFFIIPLDSLKRFKHIPEKYLAGYQVSSVNLKQHVRDYFFNEVFKK